MKNNSSNVLLAYFSRTGHTRKIAEEIHRSVESDLFEIIPKKAYPADYDECVSLVYKEQESNARPDLASHVNDMSSYDVIFVGYPSWWGTMPMPVFSFLEEYNFAGKTIIPFCTHGGSGLGSSEEDIADICPYAEVLQGLAVYGTRVNQARHDVTKWLDKTNAKSNVPFLLHNV